MTGTYGTNCDMRRMKEVVEVKSRGHNVFSPFPGLYCLEFSACDRDPKLSPLLWVVGAKGTLNIEADPMLWVGALEAAVTRDCSPGVRLIKRNDQHNTNLESLAASLTCQLE